MTANYPRRLVMGTTLRDGTNWVGLRAAVDIISASSSMPASRVESAVEQ